MTAPRPNLSSIAFWDVDMQKLNYNDNARFVIEKIMNYGLWADILEILRFYGHERVKAEVVQARYLKKKTLSFCCAIFDLTPDQFRCYTQQQSNPTPWNY
ncbi:DUF6922 domain-containing protein [Spirosoma radiotolerans]|uniref:DUF6922 domain-containing protein n=1 Tax=Spirosoma radiotolerans TaxID=1379870 RepID=A0A0E3ZY63_9BACT|nr:hypothetical protein [Spirosoma radiotolerans]AKD56834.1 hypothetical protein SD10_19930 [Spirosoma radiotolerans]